MRLCSIPSSSKTTEPKPEAQWLRGQVNGKVSKGLYVASPAYKRRRIQRVGLVPLPTRWVLNIFPITCPP